VNTRPSTGCSLLYCLLCDLLLLVYITLLARLVILTIICDNDLIPLLFPQKTTIWSGRIFCIGCYLGIFSRCLYCVIVFHFIISMYLLRTLHPMLHCICMYVDVMHLRLPDLNKETTYLLTYDISRVASVEDLQLWLTALLLFYFITHNI